MGIDGVWNDMNEPSVFNGIDYTMPVENIHRGGGPIPEGIHLRYHNVYGMLMTKASHEGILDANPGKRPFLLTRSNFLGGQRYAATWTGDNLSTWQQLKMSIPMSLNLGLSGQPFSGADIGGFGGNATPELYANWIATGVFYPFARAHKAKDFINSEPWAFGKKVENTARIAIERRYRLLPYLYTLFYESSVTGMPVMQPVFFADYKDTRLREEDQAFMLGGDLLIIPPWAEDTVLPKGNWRTISIINDEERNDKYQSELKIRPGAILPLGKIIQNTTEYSLDTLTLYVSLDNQNRANGKLYYDAGDGFAYRQGEYSLLEFKAEVLGNEVVVEVSDTNGNYPVNNRVLNVLLITDKGIKSGMSYSLKPVRIKL